MPNRIELKVGYEGQLYQIDVDTLVISLLHLSEILKIISNKVMAGEELQIRITATEKGSFNVILELAEKASSICGALFSDPKSVLDSIHKMVGLTVNFFNLKKFLKGDKPESFSLQNNGTIILIKGQVELNIPNDAYQIYSTNKDLNSHLEKMFEKLSENPEIEGFKFDGGEDGVFHANSSDFPELANNNEMLESIEQQEVLNNVSLSILKVVFQKNRKWEFIYNGNKISAGITDDGFWNQIDAGKTFAKGDVLSVDLEISKSFDDEIGCFVNRSYKVVRVIEYHPRQVMKQISLPEQ